MLSRKNTAKKNTARKNAALLVLLAFSACLSGCGKKSPIDGLVPLEGNVYFDEKPVEGATLLFLSKNTGEDAKGAGATTGATGNFKAMTLLPGDGVLPGSYTVTVQKYEYVDDGRGSEGPGSRKQILVLPAKYYDPGTTDLEVTVPPEGNKKFEIRLSGEVDLTPKPSSRSK